MFVTRGLGYPSSTLITRGLGAFDLLDLFGGSVRGSGVSAEAIGSVLSQLELLDATLNEKKVLHGVGTAIDLVGTPMAQSMMVGVTMSASPVESTVTATAIEHTTAQEVTTASEASETALTGTLSPTEALSSTPDASEDMMGSTDEDTGVK